MTVRPSKRGEPGPPQQRQQLEGVLQQLVATGDRRELPAVEVVLPLVPRQPDAAERPAAAHHIEGRDLLAELGDLPVGDAVDQGAESDPRRDPGEVGEGGRALGDVLPLGADGGDLHDVVHHRDGLEPGLLGGGGDPPEVGGELRPAAGPGELPEVEGEGERHGCLLLGCGRRGGREEPRGYELDGGVVVGLVDAVEALGG